MGDDEDEVVIAPLIHREAQENLVEESHPQEGDSTILNAFVWTLTLTACISGLLFGYESVICDRTHGIYADF